MRTYLLIFFISIACSLRAQLCQGSLGDPVVHITFGAGNSTGGWFNSVNTNYQYISGDCPQDGFYTIRHQTADCFMDTWNYIQQDHTGDPQGNFMLINASFDPSDFYLDTVKGLCPGTTYEFAAWITNILRKYACNYQGKMPNITFTIEKTDGNILSRYDSGDIPPDDNNGASIWKQYGFYFTMPQNESSVVVRMRNNQAGGCGNDLALDDITFRACRPTLGVSILGAVRDTADVCEGVSNIYSFTGQISAGFNSPALQWQTSNDSGLTWNDIVNQTTTQYTKPQSITPGEYLYRMAAAEQGNIHNSACRINSNVIAVNVNAIPHINVPVSYSLCTNDTLVLTVSGGKTYNWQGPNNFTSQDSAVIIPNPAASWSGTWYTEATSAKGCESFDTTLVTIHVAPVAGAGSDVSICQGSSAQLTGSGGGNYAWQPATGLSAPNIYNPQASPADSTMYILTVTDGNNCVVKDSVAVNVWRNPTADAGPDKLIKEGEFVTLDGAVGGTSISYNWRPAYNIDDANALQPVVSPAQDTVYTLTVTSLVGCGVVTDNVFIRVLQKVNIPNAFSPNGDGINDTWAIQKLITYPDADLFVFNRYGQPVFHSKGYYKPWDGSYNGQRLPFGTYYYMIDLKNGLPKLSGWVQIVY